VKIKAFNKGSVRQSGQGSRHRQIAGSGQ
jgi:hypothetical protein